MDHGFFSRPSGADAAPLLLDLLLEEIHAGASEEEEQAFFLSIGAKLAERFPVEGLGEVDMLEQHLNSLFGHLGLGVARLEIGSDALIIRHRLPGADSRGDGQSWLAALPPVLEGAYDGWLRSLGSGPKLRTRLVACTNGILELRHGL